MPVTVSQPIDDVFPDVLKRLREEFVHRVLSNGVVCEMEARIYEDLKELGFLPPYSYKGDTVLRFDIRQDPPSIEKSDYVTYATRNVSIRPIRVAQMIKLEFAIKKDEEAVRFVPPCPNPLHVARIKQSELVYDYIDFHYDFHRSGTCIYNGKIHRFFCDEDLDNTGLPPELDEDGDAIYYACIHTIPWKDLIKLKIRQYIFQWCVGYHWTYKNGKRVSRGRNIAEPDTRTKWQMFKQDTYFKFCKWKHKRDEAVARAVRSQSA